MKKQSLLSILSLSLVMFLGTSANASPGGEHRGLLKVTCSSEDDGEVTGILKSRFPNALSFGGDIGHPSQNRSISVLVSAQGLTRQADGKTYEGFVRLTLINHPYEVPVAAASADKVIIRLGEVTRVTVFALGQTDPEGLDCTLSLVP